MRLKPACVTIRRNRSVPSGLTVVMNRHALGGFAPSMVATDSFGVLGTKRFQAYPSESPVEPCKCRRHLIHQMSHQDGRKGDGV